MGGLHMETMFCFQCEQSKIGGCTTLGVCGKNSAVANDQDKIIGLLISFADQIPYEKASDSQKKLFRESIFSTVTNVDFNEESLLSIIANITEEAQKSNIHLEAYDMNTVWSADEDIRSLKSLLLFGIKGMAAYARHAYVLGYSDDVVDSFFFKGLAALKRIDSDIDKLLALVLECGSVNLTCMAILEKANTETYGDPTPTEVSCNIEAGPFIVMSGHDLKDLELLLEQTKDSGVNVYTHGEMLPAHAYPELKKYPHLKGNFGTAWQNQRKEFDEVPGVFIFNTNCIQKPRDSYFDRVFTSGEVTWPGCPRLQDKDFSPAIERAKELGGYSETQYLTGINGGDKLMTGFHKQAILNAAGDIVEAVKDGKISHFFLVGGCDGAKPGRNYYTEFVEKTPDDSVILTLACGKFRFNDKDMGTVAGFPRILDMGQCNDAYGAVQVALALAEAFDCSVNELPLTLVLSWYEQKAVCILLSLLSLGIKGIYLGPTLPQFVSQNVLNILIENYDIHPTSTPDEDLKSILA